MLNEVASYDPVYQILKLLEEDKQPRFDLVGIYERDFQTALFHIYEAGYANSSGLSQAGLDYILGFERRSETADLEV
ncbi:hypothetical protein D3C73_1498250 [compost metagenome]